MKQKLQHVMNKLKERKSTQLKSDVAGQKTSGGSHGEVPAEDWAMSPQDALQVGIVARYK